MPVRRGLGGAGEGGAEPRGCHGSVPGFSIRGFGGAWASLGGGRVPVWEGVGEQAWTPSRDACAEWGGGVSPWSPTAAVPREVPQAPEEPGRHHAPLLAAHGHRLHHHELLCQAPRESLGGLGGAARGAARTRTGLGLPHGRWEVRLEALGGCWGGQGSPACGWCLPVPHPAPAIDASLSPPPSSLSPLQNYPPRKDMVRAVSIQTGYLIEGTGAKSCTITYLAQVDPKGKGGDPHTNALGLSPPQSCPRVPWGWLPSG